MIWAAFSISGVGNLFKIAGPSDFDPPYVPSGKHFLYNNDPKCTANMVRAAWMEKNTPWNTISHGLASPDLGHKHY